VRETLIIGAARGVATTLSVRALSALLADTLGVKHLLGERDVDLCGAGVTLDGVTCDNVSAHVTARLADARDNVRVAHIDVRACTVAQRDAARRRLSAAVLPHNAVVTQQQCPLDALVRTQSTCRQLMLEVAAWRAALGSVLRRDDVAGARQRTTTALEAAARTEALLLSQQ
jgi:hypothetical protein